MKKVWKIICYILGLVGSFAAGGAVALKTFKVSNGNKSKFKAYYDTANQWLVIKNEGRFLEEYFVNNGYKTVAIYGMGELGNRLYEELRASKNVEVKYGIDENSGYVYSGEFKVVLPNDALEPVDVVVVTPLFDFDNIQKSLLEGNDFPVVSLEEVVFEI